ncbi:septum formation family protein [Nocardiopsis sp. NPDC006832]|uniref:septum formation family protein n=1 Tax=Nocardiopsis sp. NPDC006832 TaxID=3157188 RepID=UPI0033C9B1EE
MSDFIPAVRTVSLTLLAAGAALSLSACGIVQTALENQQGTVGDGGTVEVEDTSEGGETTGGGTQDVMEVGVGDCFNEAEMETALLGEEVSGIPLIDCSETHDSEFFHSEILPEGDFPGDDAIADTATEVCEGTAFTEFIGVEWYESEFYAYSLRPIAEGWAAGDREILCYVVANEPTTGTLEASGR